MNGSHHQEGSNTDNSPSASGQKVNGNGQKNSPQAVVKVKVGSHQKARQNKDEYRDKSKGTEGGKASPKLFGFYQTVNGVNGNDSKRKGDENSLVEAIHRHQENNLKQDAHACNHTEIFCTVFGVATALCNHISKNREGDSAQHAKERYVGEEQKAYMVEHHAHHSDDFELIVGKSEARFF